MSDHELINWTLVEMKNGNFSFGELPSGPRHFTPDMSHVTGDPDWVNTYEQFFAIGVCDGNVVRFEILKDRSKSNYINNIGPSGATQAIRSRSFVAGRSGTLSTVDEDEIDYEEIAHYARNDAYDAIKVLEQNSDTATDDAFILNAFSKMFNYISVVEKRIANDN